MLLEARGHVNAKDEAHQTCLHLAAEQGSSGVLKILLEARADVGAKDKEGNTALELTKDEGAFDCLRAGGATMPDVTDENKNDLLLRYARNGCAPLVEKVLQAGVDLAHKDEDEKTCLHLASEQGNSAVVRILVQSGADVATKDNYQSTCLHLAAEQGCVLNKNFNLLIF